MTRFVAGIMIVGTVLLDLAGVCLFAAIQSFDTLCFLFLSQRMRISLMKQTEVKTGPRAGAIQKARIIWNNELSLIKNVNTM